LFIEDTKLKEQSEAVNARTDNTIAKRKGTNIDLQNSAQKTEDLATQIPQKNLG
jgi:hypothetical protein